MARLPIGRRIRNRRRERGLTQAALAEAAGISGSYLNLIEHDKRMIGGALLHRIAAELHVDVGQLSGSADARLAHEVLEIVRSLAIAELDENAALDLVAEHPVWAQAFVTLHRSYRDARETALALSDRLSQDPTLMELSHAVLTQVTAIRSFAEILEQHAGLAPDERARFSHIIASESEQLGSSAREMITLLGGTLEAPKPSSPIEEVDDFIIFHGNHFPELEAAAERMRRELGKNKDQFVAAAELRLAERGLSAPDLPQGTPSASRRFAIVRALLGAEFGEVIEELIEDERLTTAEAQERAHHALASYAAGAALLPYEEFLEAAEAARYDIEWLAVRFAGSFEQVAHRLVTLRRPGAEGIPFAFLRSDAAGNLSKPFSIPGLRMPRHGGACPLWALYDAFGHGERTLAQMAAMPEGERYLFVARRLAKRNAPYGDVAPVFSVMLGCDAAYVDRIVYGDAFASGRGSLATPVGVNCRSCPRRACPQRARPALLPQRGDGDDAAAGGA
jgi:predicted transcriptional regulator/DNA-binding XRE family transcriptional regulator